MKRIRCASDLSVIFVFLASLLRPVTSIIAAEQQAFSFPHFADGGGYTTTWLFTGYASGQSTIDVEIIGKAGSRLSLATDRGTNSVFHLTLNGYGATSLATIGGEGL